MNKIFRYTLYGVVVLVLIGCEEAMFAPEDLPDPLPVKPTVPLKKRPIVPTSKLPRPRVAEEFDAACEAETYEAMEWKCAEYAEEW